MYVKLLSAHFLLAANTTHDTASALSNVCQHNLCLMYQHVTECLIGTTVLDQVALCP